MHGQNDIKIVSVSLYSCLSYPMSKLHLSCAVLYCILIYGLSGCTWFFHIIS